MMIADLSRFKVVYSEKVYRALSLVWLDYKKDEDHAKYIIDKPRMLEILVINEDGNIISIRDEGWCFQFIPVVNKD